MPSAPASPLDLPVLGIPVRFQPAHRDLAGAVEAAYGRWRHLDPALVTSGAPGPGPVVDLSVVPEPGGGSPESGTTIRTPRPDALVLAAPGIDARADATRFRAQVTVEEGALDDTDGIRHALDTVILFLLTRMDRQPVHGAAVARDGGAVVLAGPPGAGKSTLAYAAWRDGFQVLSDDAVYVQLQPTLRVWGLGRPGHLRADAARWFPETEASPLQARPSGDPKRAVPVHGPPPDGDAPPVVGAPGDPVGPPPVAHRAALCVVERGAGPTRAEAVDPTELVARLATELDPGFDVFRDTIRPRLDALARRGAWRLVLGGTPGDALPFLRAMVPDPPA